MCNLPNPSIGDVKSSTNKSNDATFSPESDKNLEAPFLSNDHLPEKDIDDEAFGM